MTPTRVLAFALNHVLAIFGAIVALILAVALVSAGLDARQHGQEEREANKALYESFSGYGR